MNLRKYVLITNLKYSLKYRMKNNNDMIDCILDDLYYSINDTIEQYYLDEIDRYEYENEDIKDILMQIII